MSEIEAAGCTGKVRFASHAAASRIQKRRSRDRQYAKSQVYRCRSCHGWHLGRGDPERPKHEWERYLRGHDQ